jgi:CRISPR-associated protein (TIGR03986 family)
MPHAIVPYNFVPMSERIVPAERINGKYPFEEQGILHPDRNTGWLDIEITTLTPLYTRGTREPDDTGQTDPEGYFHYGDERPVLPGSSLRGMIRSVFETMTMSRMEFVSDRRLFYRSFAEVAGGIRDLYQSRFTKDRLRAGVLMEEHGRLILRVSEAAPKGFVLVRASDVTPDWQRRGMHEYPKPRSVDVRTTNQVHSVLGVTVAELNGDVAGWLIVPGQDVGGGRGRTKRRWFQVIVDPAGGRVTDYEVPDDVYQDYLAWGTMAHGSRFKTARAPRYLCPVAPAFALVDPATQKVQAVGANMMMHLRYETGIREVSERSLSPDSAKIGVDMAQSVFGRVRDDKIDERTDQIRSRVFFQDAACNQKHPDVLLDPAHPVKVPDVLSGPKPTAFQVYLKQDRGDLQNWDSNGTSIAGRKMYWHRSPAAAAEALRSSPPDGVSDTQITQITPLRPGLTFKARIRFENLTDAELGALYAAIQLPAGMAHKFGMGRNLGLGSVRVELTEATVIDIRRRLVSPGADAGLVVGDAACARLADAYRAFVWRIFRNGTTLWADQRMLALAALLSWDGRPKDELTAQVGLSDQWKYRMTLPSPTTVGRTHGIMDVVSVGGPPSKEPVGHGDEAQAATPVPEPGHASRPQGPRVGDKVPGKLVAQTSSGTGTVLLEDGTEVIGVPGTFACKVGETYRFKVISVGGDGKVKKLARA